MTRSLKPLERVLSQRSKKGLGTAVLVLGHGLNIQAALEAGVDPADDWDPMLRGIATEMGISGEDFDRLPDSTPLRWDSLVEWKAVAADCTLEEADLSLKGRLAHALRAAEERTKSLPLYGRVLSAGFENSSAAGTTCSSWRRSSSSARGFQWRSGRSGGCCISERAISFPSHHRPRRRRFT